MALQRRDRELFANFRVVNDIGGAGDFCETAPVITKVP